MPRSKFRLLLTTVLAAPFLAEMAAAQTPGKVGKYSDTTITGAVLEPEKLQVSDDAQLTGLLKVPEGFRVEVFARDLVNPRILAVSPAGHLYASRRSVGDIVLLKDENSDGKADSTETVASRPGMHGIAFDGNQVFLVTVNDVYTADVREDGTFRELRRIINDLPDAGQHPNRTLAIGPDGMLYITVGSTCNACAESNPENATILRASKDGKTRSIFASGLRNTIGFGWEPSSGALYGMDHGIDWLGDEVQIEELNLIEKGKQYGWPYVYGMSEMNPQDNPPEGMTLEQWAKLSAEPELGYTAHSAPMQMAFATGGNFPAEYQGDAFVAMRGSWNRRPPSGYEVVRIDFENGKPVKFERFLENFLIQQENGNYGYLGRPVGVAFASNGMMFVSDDSNGIIYRISNAEEGEPGDVTASTSSASPAPNAVEEEPPSKIALELIEAKSDQTITVRTAFEAGQEIPLQFVADGDNASPRLELSGIPEGTKSMVIIMDDPDAAKPKPFTHWIVYDIPAGTTSLREGLPTEPILQDPKDVKQGTNSMGATGYFGPKPPVGDPPHNYHVQVFALDIETLGIDPGAKRDQVLEAMKDHVLAKGEIVGTFQRGENVNAQQQ